MSGSSRSISRTVGTNFAASASAVAPVCATRASPNPAACSNAASALAASTSSSTTNMRAIPLRGSPALCALDGRDGCARTTICSTQAHRPGILVARFEALDLAFGLITGDAVRVSDLTREAGTPTCNQVQVRGSELSPVCVHLAAELRPTGFDDIPVHSNLPNPPG